MLAAPFAAINFESLKDLKKTFQSFSDKIYYGEVLPPVGSLSLSYSKFLDLLDARHVKRITILADGKVALVEVRSVQSSYTGSFHAVCAACCLAICYSRAVFVCAVGSL